MKTKQIRKMIQDAVADEKRTGKLATAMETVARQAGLRPSQEAVDQAVGFVREYIEHVPLLLEQGMAVAKQVGLQAEMNQMAAELEAYWFEPDDVIPDHFGLYGLMDDAYASLLLLQLLSDYCKATVGRPLLSQDLTKVNQFIRQAIGEPAASMLDQRVGITVANTMTQRMVSQAVGAGFAFNYGGGPDPIWGNASIEEIAETRLGAMGVVF